MQLLRQGRSLVRIGRRLALATAACMQRCCGPQTCQLYWFAAPCVYPSSPGCQYTLPNPWYLCSTTVTCGGQPLALGRVVLIGPLCYTITALVPVGSIPPGAGRAEFGDFPCVTSCDHGSCLRPGGFARAIPCRVGAPDVWFCRANVPHCVYAGTSLNPNECYRFDPSLPTEPLPPGAFIRAFTPEEILTLPRSCCDCQTGCTTAQQVVDLGCGLSQSVRCCCPVTLTGARAQYTGSSTQWDYGDDNHELFRREKSYNATAIWPAGVTAQVLVREYTEGVLSNQYFEFLGLPPPRCIPPPTAVDFANFPGAPLCPEDSVPGFLTITHAADIGCFHRTLSRSSIITSSSSHANAVAQAACQISNVPLPPQCVGECPSGLRGSNSGRARTPSVGASLLTGIRSTRIFRRVGRFA